jgi:hypothetical protein
MLFKGTSTRFAACLPLTPALGKSNMRTGKIILTLVAAVGLVACGEVHRDAAISYHSAAERALIQAGKCMSRTDCSTKEMAFWAGGNKALPWADKAYVTVYNVSDSQTITSIKQYIKEKRTSLSGPPCRLTIFEGSHDNQGNKAADETL